MQHRRNPDVLVETLSLRGKRVIDVGCGDGHMVRLMAQNGASVLGVECSPRQLAKAMTAERIADEDIVEGVGQSLPAPSASVDIVTFVNSLHHIPPAAQLSALSEAVRVLKPHGQVYISEPLPEGAFFEAVQPIDDETAVRAAALAAIQAAPRIGLRPEAELRYIHPIRMDSYEAFRERIISANSEREAKFAAMDTEMRALFAAKAERTADGSFAFEQPMRVNLLLRD